MFHFSYVSGVYPTWSDIISFPVGVEPQGRGYKVFKSFEVSRGRGFSGEDVESIIDKTFINFNRRKQYVKNLWS